jgi:hypothetical protein
MNKNTWQTIIDFCGKEKIEFLNCPTNNIDERVYDTRIKDMWWFKCSCDAVFSTRLGSILDGKIKGCGCKSGSVSIRTWNDIIDICIRDDLKFANLPTDDLNAPIYLSNSPNVWKFICKCGKDYFPRLNSLLSRKSNSCGCSHTIYTWKDVLIICEELKFEFVNCPEDINKSVFNTKTAGIWKFKCQCGERFSPSLNNMLAKHYLSCGNCKIDKHIWQEVLEVCNKNSLNFINCPKDVDGRVYDTEDCEKWKFRCFCGTYFYSRLNYILYDVVRSCGCAKRNNKSKEEMEVFDYIKGLGIVAEERDRKQIAPKELDIYMPELNMAVEYCGLRWHGEKLCKDKAELKHITKLQLCRKKGIELITIFSDEWLNKKEQVKSYLMRMFGLVENIVSVDNCVKRRIDDKIAKQFHILNSIHDFINGEHYGSYLNDELLSIATFSNRIDSNVEIRAYVEKTNYSINGGIKEVIARYKIDNPQVNQITAYSDNRWPNEQYGLAGFELDSHYDPAVYYFNPGDKQKIRYSSDVGHEKMSIDGYDRIWDCGKIKWVCYLGNK